MRLSTGRSEKEQVAALLPGQHGGVGVVGLLSLPVFVHGRTDLALHLDEVVHGVERQLDVVSLQPDQMVWLRRNRTAFSIMYDLVSNSKTKDVKSIWVI